MYDNSLYDAMLADVDTDSLVAAALDALNDAHRDLDALRCALPEVGAHSRAVLQARIQPAVNVAAAALVEADHAVCGYAAAHTSGGPSCDVATLGAAATSALVSALSAWLGAYTTVSRALPA